MSLFRRKTAGDACCCGSDACADKAASGQTAHARVKVLASGCKKCLMVEENAKTALRALAMDDAVDHVTDYVQIASYGVMTTPALVVDGKVVSSGRVLSAKEVEAFLKNA